MNRIITKEKQFFEFFNKEVIEKIQATIASNVIEHDDIFPSNDKFIAGGFYLKGIPTLNKGPMNVWLEFTAKRLEGNMFDTSISNCIIYSGGMPDNVLDRYNILKKYKEEEEEIN